MSRKMIIDAIKTDPEWKDGNYNASIQPRGLITALYILTWMGSCPLQLQAEAPDRDSADALLDKRIAAGLAEKDASNTIYAFDASWDYDPAPHLGGIKAPLVAVNFADDQINPPELGIFEREVKKIPRGEAIMVPISEETRGHGTHTIARVWVDHLKRLLDISKK